jgi:hypothetical protein
MEAASAHTHTPAVASATKAAATTAVAAATAAATTAAATRQRHGRRRQANRRNCQQRDHCLTQHHHSPSQISAPSHDTLRRWLSFWRNATGFDITVTQLCARD